MAPVSRPRAPSRLTRVNWNGPTTNTLVLNTFASPLLRKTRPKRIRSAANARSIERGATAVAAAPVAAWVVIGSSLPEIERTRRPDRAPESRSSDVERGVVAGRSALDQAEQR